MEYRVSFSITKDTKWYIDEMGACDARAETRRDWLRAEEEKMKRDREAQWLARSLTEPSPEKPP